VKANDSSSSAANPPEVDLRPFLPPIPRALVEGRDLDLVAPLHFVGPGERPREVAAKPGRTSLARALADANAGYGHPGAERLAEKLADPATRVVVTGQQPGLYGGPLLALSKMSAAVRWAEALEAAGQPAVAVFWVATEDHDWAEMSHARVHAPREEVDLDLGDDPSPLTPVGMRTFGPGLQAANEKLLEAFPGEDSERWLEPVTRFYRPDTRFGEAFSRLMVQILGERAPLMLDSMLAELKMLEQPFLERLVSRRVEVEEALASGDRRLEERGYPLQVKPQPGASPLFLYRGGERRRIEWRGDDRWGLRGVDDFEAPVEKLLEIIEENPSVVSPGVQARPAVQDGVLGTTLQVMGPAELSYVAQIAGIYPVLEIEPPSTTLRPQALVLEERQLEHLRELDVDLAEILPDDLDLDRLLVEHLGEDVVAPVRREVGELLEGLREPIVELDQNLERPWEKTRDQIDRALDQLSAKTAAAAARRHEVRQRRLERLREACRPGGKPQERSLAVVHFLGRHGPSFGRTFLDQLGLDPGRLHVIVV